MVEKLHRSSLDERYKDENRRRAIIMLLAALMIFLLIFTCGQLAMMISSSIVEGDASSRMQAEYGPWSWDGPVFGGLNPGIVAEAARDGSLELLLASSPAPNCFLLGACTPFPLIPTDTPTPTPSPTITLTPTNTPTPSVTPTASNTPLPTFTFTPIFTATNTPTPTPLVWPLKIVNPGNVDPDIPFDLVTVNIVVVNYGNPTGAQLTDIIDRMPPQMSFVAGSCNIIPGPSVPCNLAGNTLTWSFAPARIIPQNQFVLASFQARVSGLNAGDIINNEAETRGGNFDTSTYIRRIYAYTPTPTPIVPVAVDDIITTNEDTPVDIYVMNNNGNGPDTNLLEPNFSVSVTSGPTFGSTSVSGSPGLPASVYVTYTPRADYFGPDSFVYQLCDASLDCDTATVSITVNPLDDTPFARADAVSTNEDTAIAIQVLADNGSGADINFDYPITVDMIGLPSNGVVAPLTRVDPAWPPSAFFTYNPNLNWYGTDTFTYRITDVDLDTSTAVVTVTVNARNDPPVAVNDTGYSVIEDQSLDTAILPGPPPPNGSVLTNDSDVDCTGPITDCNPTLAGNNPLTAIPVVGQATANGSVDIRADGTFVYTPRSNFFGLDSFTYTVTDGSLSASGSVTITVTPDPADIPVAVADSFSVVEDTPTQLDVLANDAGWFDIPLTLEIGTAPTNGSAVIQYINNAVIPPVIRILYTPNLNYYSPPGLPDSFTYCVRDIDDEPNNPCLPGDFVSVTVTVTSVHDPPTAVDDSATVLEDGVVVIDVLRLGLPVGEPGEDIPGDDAIDPATVCISGRPCPLGPGDFPLNIANGRITAINPATGEITYAPNADYNGSAVFEYSVADTPTGARSNTATVNISITPQNDTPNAVPDNGFTTFGIPVLVDVLLDNGNGPDTGIGDTPLTVSVEAQPPPGEGTCSPSGNSINFTPGGSFAGTTTCTYRVTDFDGEWDTADITFYVNTIPVAVADTDTINEDQLTTIDILANDYDPDFPANDIDPTSVTITNSPSNAAVFSVDPLTGVVTYQPLLGYNGTDSFDYEVEDTHAPPATSNTVSVDITINAVNYSPVALDDTAFTQEDTALNIDVLANDSDPLDSPPDPLILWITSFVDPGTISSTTSIDTNGSPQPDDDTLLYTPTSGDFGTENLTYTICDPGVDGIPGNGDDLCDSATVTVTVNGWPTAVDDFAMTNQGSSVIIFPLANDSDPDSPVGNWRITTLSDPPDGTVTNNAGLSVTYTPDTGYISPPGTPDSFTYTMIDGDGGSASATVFVNVLDTDSTPVANDDPTAGIITVNEAQTVNIAILTNDAGLGDEPLTITTSGLSFPGCPANGTLSIIGSPGPASGISIDYTAPINDCSGVVTFQYTVTDGDTGPYLPPESDTATVTVNVSAVNDPPVAVLDTDTTLEETSVTIDVAANDTDEETNVVAGSVSIASCPAGASCVHTGGGIVSFTPAVDFFGLATFTYSIEDTLGATSAPGIVEVNVTNVNDPPNASPRSASADQGQTINIDLVAFVSDPDLPGEIDWSSLTVTSGACTPSGTGLQFTAPATATLVYTCDYQISDIYGASDAGSRATVTININQPVLQVSKDFSTGSALPGDTVGFSITIFNLGPGTAFDVTIADSLGACFTWGSDPSGLVGNIADGGAAIRFGSVYVPNPLPPGCVDGENINTANITAANTSPYSDSDTLSLPFGGGPPMGGAASAMMLSAPVETDTPTPTPTETPAAVLMGMSAPAGGAGLAVTGLGFSAPLATNTPAGGGGLTAPGSLGVSPPTPTGTAMPPTSSPGGSSPTTITPSGAAPSATPDLTLTPGTTPTDPPPTAAVSPTSPLPGSGPAASPTTDPGAALPTATSLIPTAVVTNTATGPSAGSPVETSTPPAGPTPTPVPSAPTSTEATFTLLIPLMMLIGPFLYAWSRGWRPAST